MHSDSEKTKRVRLDLDPADHDLLWDKAHGEKKSMARWVKDLVLAAIRPEPKGDPK